MRKPGFPSRKPGFPAGKSGFPARRPGFPDGKPAFPVRKPGFPAGKPSFLAGEPSFPAGKPGFPARKPGFPAGNHGYPKSWLSKKGPSPPFEITMIPDNHGSSPHRRENLRNPQIQKTQRTTIRIVPLMFLEFRPENPFPEFPQSSCIFWDGRGPFPSRFFVCFLTVSTS